MIMKEKTHQISKQGLTLFELLFFLVAVAAVGATWGITRATWGFWCGFLAGAIVATVFAVIGLWANECCARARTARDVRTLKPEVDNRPNNASQPIAGKPGSG